jgi:hypothetical protein
MVATNDDICLKLDKIINLLQGMYGNQNVAEQIKLSNDVKATIEVI